MSDMDPEVEGSEADRLEQEQPLGDAAPNERPDATIEASEADISEQRRDV